MEKTNTNEDVVVLISSDRIGSGDEGLGTRLMDSFLTTLTELDGRLSHVLFVNGGARLVTEGSPVLEQLRTLDDSGAELHTCRTCLRHFELEDRVAVGEVSNMPTIVETLSRAGRTIQL